MPNNLEILLSAATHLVQEKQLAITDKQYDEKHFGNAFVTLESIKVRLRFVYDRGQLFADIGSTSSSQNTDLSAALNQIPNAIRKNTSEWANVQELIDVIDKHYDELEKFVSKK